METRQDIIEGMATILWASAWADHVEEHGCCNLSGCEITEHMPAIPQSAYDLTDTIVACIESANSATIEQLYAAALAADVASPEALACARKRVDLSTATRFGECLAYAAMGAGVSWFDDHAEFPLEAPDVECFLGVNCV